MAHPEAQIAGRTGNGSKLADSRPSQIGHACGEIGVKGLGGMVVSGPMAGCRTQTGRITVRIVQSVSVNNAREKADIKQAKGRSVP